MTITRAAKGTAFSKTSGTSLALNDVSAFYGDVLVVGIVYNTGAGAPTVKWGFRSLRQKSTATQTESGIAVATFVLNSINNSATRNIVATWGSAISAKAMIVTSLTGANMVDVATKQGQTATSSPDTDLVTSSIDDTISIAFFGSEGPSSDTVGTVGSGHTSGQRVGTVGAPPISNVTIHETYEILTSTGTIQSTKTGATVRDWASVICAWKSCNGTVNQAVTESDYITISEKFESSSKDFSLLVTIFNDELDRFEAFESTDMATVICHSANGWE